MKKVLVLALVVSACAFAQRGRPFGVMTSDTPPDPATMVQNHVNRLTKLLNLDASQAAQATTIFTNAATAVAPLESKLNTDWQSMRAAVKNSPGTIDQLAAEIGSLTGQIAAIQNKADAAFYAILTADQKTKLDQSGGFGGRGRGMGGPGMMGPGMMGPGMMGPGGGGRRGGPPPAQ
jgi:Spy/CpxP family protein refolding chaperone